MFYGLYFNQKYRSVKKIYQQKKLKKNAFKAPTNVVESFSSNTRFSNQTFRHMFNLFFKFFYLETIPDSNISD